MTFQPLSIWSLNSLGSRQYSILFYGSAVQARVILHSQEDPGNVLGPRTALRGVA